MNILLIRFSALGDVAMLAAVVREMAQERPDDDLTVLSLPKCAPLFNEIAPNVHFLGRDVKHDYKGIRGLYRLFKEIHHKGASIANPNIATSDDGRGPRFDFVCDMHDVLRTKILRKFFRLHGYSYSKINKHREYRKRITAQGDKKELIQVPTSFENYRETTPQPLSRPTGTLSPKGGKGLYGNDSLTNNTPHTKNSIKDSPSGGRRVIGIAPFAAHKGKIYPLEKMERVIQLLKPHPALPEGEGDRLPTEPYKRGLERDSVILFGGGGKEREIMQQWADKYPWVHMASEVIANKGYNVTSTPPPRGGQGGASVGATLRDELRLMRDLDVMVSMDSANMHLASLMGTRVVSIWGATHPFAGFLGYGQSLNDCVQLDLPCRPCSIYGNKPCIYGDHRCMTGITPEMIVDRIFR